MKVKVAFLETDKNYLQRIVAALSTKYADKLQLYSYTDKEAAAVALRTERISVIVSGTGFEFAEDDLPASCGLAYLTDSMDVASYRGHPAICKFQKAEQIYKGILSVYAETSDGDPCYLTLRRRRGVLRCGRFSQTLSAARQPGTVFEFRKARYV